VTSIFLSGMDKFSALQGFSGTVPVELMYVFDIVYVFKNWSPDSSVVIYECHETLDVVFI
jgi:hypothetical protein